MNCRKNEWIGKKERPWRTEASGRRARKSSMAALVLALFTNVLRDSSSMDRPELEEEGEEEEDEDKVGLTTLKMVAAACR